MNKIFLSGILAAVVIISGCTQSTTPSQDGGQGEFELLVSDQPTEISQFDYVRATLSEARVYEANTSENQTDEYQTIELEPNTTVDLRQLQGDRATSVINETLDAGNYSAVHISVSDVNASFDGESADVMIPSERLKINQEFTVTPNETTSFVFDINVVRRGQSGSYNLLPVISESGVVGEDVEVERVPRERGSQNSTGDQAPETPAEAP